MVLVVKSTGKDTKPPAEVISKQRFCSIHGGVTIWSGNEESGMTCTRGCGQTIPLVAFKKQEVKQQKAPPVPKPVEEPEPEPEPEPEEEKTSGKDEEDL